MDDIYFLYGDKHSTKEELRLNFLDRFDQVRQGMSLTYPYIFWDTACI